MNVNSDWQCVVSDNEGMVEWSHIGTYDYYSATNTGLPGLGDDVIFPMSHTLLDTGTTIITASQLYFVSSISQV